MAALQCEICGGKLKAIAGGLFECDSCGLQYDKTRVQEMVQEIKGTVKVEGTVQVSGSVQVDSTTANQKLIQRMYITLKDSEFAKASQLAEQILETDPENADAYLGKLMAKKKVCEKGDISSLWLTFDHEPEYKNVMQYGSEEMKKLLVDANKAIVDRQKKSIADDHLTSAQDYFNDGLYEKAIKEYRAAASHHKVTDQIEKCQRMIYARDSFQVMCKKACTGSNEKIKEAYEFFQDHQNYIPCGKAGSLCKRILDLTANAPKVDTDKINQLNKEIEELNEKKDQASANLKQLGLFAKKEKKNALRDEIAAIDSKLQTLLTQQSKLVNVEDEYKAKCQKLYGELMFICDVLQLQNAKVGQRVTFGRYYRTSKSLEPLTWTVFKKDRYIYLLTTEVIDSVEFGSAYSGKLLWKDSQLYKWLNNTFYNTAFRDYEKKYIVEVTEPTKNDLEWRRKYPAKATDYAISKRVTTKYGNACWFLQSDCYSNYCPDKVTEDGTALGGYSMQGVIIHNLREGVRPMIILDLSKLK